MMDKFERGKRADVGVYDDAWIKGDDAVEMVVPSPPNYCMIRQPKKNIKRLLMNRIR